MATPRLTTIWADTLRHEVCKAASCRRPVFFAQNVRTGNWMIFDVRPVPVVETRELETNRLEWSVDLSQAITHFATCSARAQFGRRAAR